MSSAKPHVLPEPAPLGRAWELTILRANRMYLVVLDAIRVIP